MKDKIVEFLRREYDIEAEVIKPLSGGVGGNRTGFFSIYDTGKGNVVLLSVIPMGIIPSTRSFFYAEATCAEGGYVEEKLNDYVERYVSEASLTRYDRDNLIKLYIYQLAVCDYYAQYFEADADKKAEYRSRLNLLQKC